MEDRQINGQRYRGNDLCLRAVKNDTVNFDLLKILDEERLKKLIMPLEKTLTSEDIKAYKPILEKYHVIIDAYVDLLKNKISKTLETTITPYAFKGYYNTNDLCTSQFNISHFYHVYFFLGKRNWKTKYSGKYVAELNILVDNSSGLTWNDLTFHCKDLFDPLRDVCSTFSEARGLKCVSAIKEQNIRNTLWYHKELN